MTAVTLAAVARAHGRRADGEALRAAAARTAPTAVSHPGLDALARGKPMDLNRATKADLMALPRIGPALADRILARRAALGGFQSVADLDSVAGVGERTLANLQPFVTVSTPPAVTPRPSKVEEELHPETHREVHGLKSVFVEGEGQDVNPRIQPHQ